MSEYSMLVIALIGLVAFACQWLAWRVKLPAILFLLASGLLLGPVAHVVQPDALFGDLLFPLISLCVAIILFEGSLTLEFSQIRAQQGVVRRLVLIGAAITWCVVAVAAHYIFQLDWALSVLFGALTVVTGPTVIVPMLRTVRPKAAIANILRWEGIIIDPIGALLVVVVFEFIVAQSQSVGVQHSLVIFVKILGIGTALGIAGGWFLGLVLRKHWVPEYLLNLATLSLVFVVFSVSDYFAHESGLLAVTVMGMWLANQKGIHIKEILNFKENLSVVLISGLFILLAARLTLEDIQQMNWLSLVLLLVVIQFLARPLSVLASTLGSDLSWRERALLCWIAPRGIVAAAVSALFAIRLQPVVGAQAELLVPLTFTVIIGTVVLQSATARLIARLLGVAEPAPKGFLVVGANPVARAVAKALKEQGFRALLTDTNWDNISAARMAGLETFYGNPVSGYADQHLDLVGIGKLLGLSPRADLNSLAAMRYRSEFGIPNLYTLLAGNDAKTSEKHQTAESQRGHILFGDQLTYSKFASLLSRGAEIRTTKLSEEFSFDEYLEAHGNSVTPLFAISPRGRLQVFVKDGEFTPQAGWTLIVLNASEVEEKETKAAEAKASPDNSKASNDNS